MRQTAISVMSALVAVFFLVHALSAYAHTEPSRYYASQSAALAACDAARPALLSTNGGPHEASRVSGCRAGGPSLTNTGLTCPFPGGCMFYRIDHDTEWGDDYGSSFLYPDSFTCPTGQVVRESDGACVVPPPVVDCSKEAGKETYLKDPDGSGQCVKVSQAYYPNGPSGNWEPVEGSCEALMVISVPSVSDPATGARAAKWRFTGEPCSAADVNTVAEPPDSNTGQTKHQDKACLATGSGVEACVGKSEGKNCGTVNGNSVCVDDPPPGNCTFIAGGSWVCDSAAATPPKPPVSPVVVMNGRGPTGQPRTIQIFPEGAEGGDSGSTVTGGGPGGKQGDGMGCGGEGQPKCAIDETGTPEWGNGEGGDPTSILDGAQGIIDATPGAASAADSSSLRSTISGALPSGGDCAPIELTVAGHTVTLDGATKFAAIRQGLAWAFGLVAAYGVLMAWLRKS